MSALHNWVSAVIGTSERKTKKVVVRSTFDVVVNINNSNPFSSARFLSTALGISLCADQTSSSIRHFPATELSFSFKSDRLNHLEEGGEHCPSMDTVESRFIVVWLLLYWFAFHVTCISYSDTALIFIPCWEARLKRLFSTVVCVCFDVLLCALLPLRHGTLVGCFSY